MALILPDACLRTPAPPGCMAACGAAPASGPWRRVIRRRQVAPTVSGGGCEVSQIFGYPPPHRPGGGTRWVERALRNDAGSAARWMGVLGIGRRRPEG
jgi:hypothetical protein